MKFGMKAGTTDGYEIKVEVEEYDDDKEDQYIATIEAESLQIAKEVGILYSWVQCMKITEGNVIKEVE